MESVANEEPQKQEEPVQSEKLESEPVVPRLVPIVETSKAQHTEAIFAPIKPATCFEPARDPCDNEDSNSSRRMSREDIETMEILQSKDAEDSKSSWPDTPNTDTQISTSANSALQDLSVNEDSVASTTASSVVTRNTDPIVKQGKMFSAIAAADLIEYQWPADDNSDYYMIQEQISTFLGITSFKRKYPEIERRKLDPQEMNHLMLNMLVSEVQLTLGLTAVRSRDVCDMMMKEYPEKYQEYTQVLDEKRKENIKNKHLQYSTPTVEKSQMPSYIKKAMKQVSDFNARLNRQRKDDYSVYYDMQTNVLQFPNHKMKKVHPDYTRPSLYPCALIPGQFQEFCQKYSPSELGYFPLNTVVYGPPPPPPPDTADSLADSESEREMESAETETAEGEKTEKSQDEGDGAESLVEKVEDSRDSTNIASDIVQDSNDQTESNPAEDDTAECAAAETDKDIEKPSEPVDTALNKSETDQSVMAYIDDPDKAICGICLKDETCNKRDEPEDLISCSQCDNYGHPSCLDMSKELVSVIVTYNWQCLECKTCTYCSKPHHEDKMMFCDRCDRGYHTFCVGLRNLPSGLWICPQCNRSDPDFAKKSGSGKRSNTPRKRKNSDSAQNASFSTDAAPKQRRKRRTKKEMEEAREKERLEKEEKVKRKNEKKGEKEERKKKKRQKKEQEEIDQENEMDKKGDDKSIDENKKEDDLPQEEESIEKEQEAQTVENGS